MSGNPTIDDDGYGFFEEFEEICGLANNSKGMSPIEMVHTLGSCLKGSRKHAYKVELKTARHDGRLKEHPDAVYSAIIARLQEFKEGLLEKQQRQQQLVEEQRRPRQLQRHRLRRHPTVRAPPRPRSPSGHVRRLPARTAADFATGTTSSARVARPPGT